MIASVAVEEIKQLLRDGSLSQRKIARRTGVSRGTVNAIALGTRKDGRPQRRKEGGEFVPPSGPFVRCPLCGGRVQMPCLLCRVRSSKEREQLRSGKQDAAGGHRFR